MPAHVMQHSAGFEVGHFPWRAVVAFIRARTYQGQLRVRSIVLPGFG
jgi:hypothetical protein